MDLKVYKKGETTSSFTGTDTDGVAITGLPAGTVVATGDYQVGHSDPDGKLLDSDKVDVPGFTVNKAKAPTPTGVTATPTNDGAKITVAAS